MELWDMFAYLGITYTAILSLIGVKSFFSWIKKKKSAKQLLLRFECNGDNVTRIHKVLVDEETDTRYLTSWECTGCNKAYPDRIWWITKDDKAILEVLDSGNWNLIDRNSKTTTKTKEAKLRPLFSAGEESYENK